MKKNNQSIFALKNNKDTSLLQKMFSIAITAIAIYLIVVAIQQKDEVYPEKHKKEEIKKEIRFNREKLPVPVIKKNKKQIKVKFISLPPEKIIKTQKVKIKKSLPKEIKKENKSETADILKKLTGRWEKIAKETKKALEKVAVKNSPQEKGEGKRYKLKKSKKTTIKKPKKAKKYRKNEVVTEKKLLVIKEAAPKESISDKKKLLEAGEALLNEKGRKKFPPIEADYDQIGFERYIREVAKAGGRFFVADAYNRNLVLEYDPFPKLFKKNFSNLRGLAIERPRMINQDSKADKIIDDAEVMMGLKKGSYELVLFVKREFDALLVARLNHRLKKSAIKYSNYFKFVASYSYSKGGLFLKVKSAIGRDGRRYPINEIFPL